MNKEKQLRFLLLLISFLVFNLGIIEAVEIGGNLQINNSLFYYNQLKADLNITSELEFYIPQTNTIKTRLLMQSVLTDEGTELGTKYLYLRYRGEKGHITIGRQPVSWSYGAMFNLLDYGLGIDNLAAETITPGIDGIRYFYPLGAGRSLQLLTSFPEFTRVKLNDLGYGARLRFPGSGYDLSFNLASQPLINPLDNGDDHRLFRIGSSYKGDLGDVGIYGSLGYYYIEELDKDDIMIQLGLDYSYFVGEFQNQHLIIQAEYYRFLQDELSAGVLGLIKGAKETSAIDFGDDNAPTLNLLGSEQLLINLALNLDYFSTVGVILLTEFTDNTVVLSPYYLNDLGGGLNLRIDGNLMRDIKGDFYPGISTGLSFYF